ncbi:MAG: type IV toxin-antitoxin system AbiEi family antitoxin domain-containing protein [Muribaculaceae bacterium]|nr:type IV toxin-antitoxin system AbiEi family antitoxin domain-containing protein [Muribaculaceae bacterium]
MKSLESNVQQKIWRMRKGSIFFSEDFLSMGTQAAVNKALSELAKKGIIIRLAPGIYCKPQKDEVFGLGVMYPGIDQIAQAIAARDKAEIVPTGIYAQNRLGLSTQIPMNAVYLTNGSARRIKIYNGKGILFKRVSPKHFKFKNKLALMLTLALKDIGEDNVTDEQKKTIKKIVNKESKQSLAQDYVLMPDWIRTLIESLYD